MKDMTEDNDGEGSAFEDRVRGLFEGDVAPRGVNVASVIAGARKRRVRRRATTAGSSVAVLGVAAGVVAFGMHSAGPAPAPGVNGTEAAGTVRSSAGTTTTPAGPASPAGSKTTESTAATAGTCSASVTGSVPGTTSVTADGLDFEKVSGTTAGVPWSVRVHAFPDWQSWLDWRRTQTDPPVPSNASHVLGPPALVRVSDRPAFTMTAIPHYSFVFAGGSIGGGVDGTPKKYLLETWALPTVDHLCLQFAHRAEFEPAYRVQGGAFAVFGYTAADEPQKVIGYDTAGQVVGTATGMEGLLPPDGK